MTVDQVADKLGAQVWWNVAARARALQVLEKHRKAVSAMIDADLKSGRRESVERAARTLESLGWRTFRDQILKVFMADDEELAKSVETPLIWDIYKGDEILKPLLERVEKDPKFLLALPVKVGSQWVPKGEWVDSYPDGPWFYIKSYPDPLQLWDFTDAEHPRKLWEEAVEGDYDRYGWQAGVPTGELLLAPRLPYLKAMTAPRPSQVPTGRLEWRAATRTSS
jgi:hypothetical protein